MWRGLYCGVACCSLVACRGDAPLPYQSAAPAEAAPREPEDERANASSFGAGGEPAAVDPTSGAGQTTTDGPSCAAERVSLADIHAGRVRGAQPVTVGSLVASSQKFLVSEAKSGSCLWGAFAAAVERRGAGSGLLLVAFGTPHRDGEPCRHGEDGIPDDLTPGDLIEVRGFVDEFAPSACDGVAASPQLRVDASCPVHRMGRATPPEPAAIDFELADRLAQGTDRSLLRDWAGALVRLETVSALQDPEDGDAVFPFGVVRLAETRLEVRSRLYYFDLTEGGPRASAKSPRYEHPRAFASVTGLVLLDYCTWVLAPRDRCVDMLGSACAPQATGP